MWNGFLDLGFGLAGLRVEEVVVNVGEGLKGDGNADDGVYVGMALLGVNADGEVDDLGGGVVGRRLWELYGFTWSSRAFVKGGNHPQARRGGCSGR